MARLGEKLGGLAETGVWLVRGHVTKSDQFSWGVVGEEGCRKVIIESVKTELDQRKRKDGQSEGDVCWD